MADEEEKSRGSDNGLLDLVKYLFREFVAEKELTTDQLQDIDPAELEIWITEFVHSGGEDLKTRLCVDGPISSESYDFLNEIFSKAGATRRMLRYFWAMLVLGPQPPLKHKVNKVSVMISIEYQDHTPLTLVSDCVSDPDLAFTNALAVSSLQQAFQGLLNAVVEQGLDKLAEKEIRESLDIEKRNAK